MTVLNELLERVRSATGPDRELDADLIKALGCHSWAGRMRYHDGQKWVDFGGSNITTSVDAALGLVERMLSGWMWTIYHEYVITEKPNVVFLKHKNIDLPLEIGEARGDHETVPLAILAALLSALISKESQS